VIEGIGAAALEKLGVTVEKIHETGLRARHVLDRSSEDPLY